MVCCVFSLELPHRCDSNEYTQYIIFNIKRKSPEIIPNLQLWDFSKEPKNEFETAVVNEPSVFEPLKVCCIYFYYAVSHWNTHMEKDKNLIERSDCESDRS